MTGFRLERFPFTKDEVVVWGATNAKHRNWPVVYVMNNGESVYVGESLNAEVRMRQHLETAEKKDLEWVRVVLGDKFNKSACLDLESYLISMFAGDGKFQVLNRNEGIVDADYFDRAAYRQTFKEVFEYLRLNEDLFTRSIPEIINSDLFKLSPFKALNMDQAAAVEDILEGLFRNLELEANSLSIVQGNPGTGKTIVAIYLIKLLEDIRDYDQQEPLDSDSIFTDFFTPGHPKLLENRKIGFVIPQQSLRLSVKRVFKRTPGLKEEMVLSPFDVGERTERFDILIVDEAHRLGQVANQSSAGMNQKFSEISRKLFPEASEADRLELTQLDWITQQSRHVILMLDTGQSVRPADLPDEVTSSILAGATESGAIYPLRTQMRVKAEQDYVGYVRDVLAGKPTRAPEHFPGYDLRFFDNLSAMQGEILARNQEHGLARLVAGYAWPWKSKKDKQAFDIELDGLQLRWNSTDKDWINAKGSEYEVGSIHTVQGYDLNYAGVIIGNDLKYDTSTQSTRFDRASYFDTKGKENNKKRGINYTDEQLLSYVQNIYAVLLTRGILGTYVFVADADLRSYLRNYFGQ
ncbi:DUF2075 domain-containing protein [Haematomicrobium sanguinis]|uniref:DUF2075 domain-containing protein n=1 Tax=Haematomicrobium sanguinis TaxID=479106 RepID=UPI00047E1E39|nr:DUF2075 domain-containing protein [Haematomicrobium sanguinis]